MIGRFEDYHAAPKYAAPSRRIRHIGTVVLSTYSLFAKSELFLAHAFVGIVPDRCSYDCYLSECSILVIHDILSFIKSFEPFKLLDADKLVSDRNISLRTVEKFCGLH